jgi:hypothetical protein
MARRWPRSGSLVPADLDARVSGRTQWLVAASLWVIAGFAFPFLSPATNLFARDLQQYLATTAGMSDELAYRVAFTIVRVPLTAVLATVIAAMQSAVVPRLRPLAQRWLSAAAAAGCVSTLIWLPTTLIAAQLVGNTSQGTVRLFLLTFGAGLLAGLVSFTQRRTTRPAVTVPGSFTATGVLASVLGASGGSAV